MLALVSRLTMRTHDSRTGRDAVVQHLLHDFALLTPFGQTHAEALPVAASPSGFRRQDHARDVACEFRVSLYHGTPSLNHLRQTFKLLAADGCLDVRHAVVIPELQVFFEYCLL